MLKTIFGLLALLASAQAGTTVTTLYEGKGDYPTKGQQVSRQLVESCLSRVTLPATIPVVPTPGAGSFQLRVGNR